MNRLSEELKDAILMLIVAWIIVFVGLWLTGCSTQEKVLPEEAVDMIVFPSASEECPATTIEACCGETWGTPNDWSVLRTARKRCVHHFPQSPCVIKIVKKPNQHYNVSCGRKE